MEKQFERLFKKAGVSVDGLIETSRDVTGSRDGNSYTYVSPNGDEYLAKHVFRGKNTSPALLVLRAKGDVWEEIGYKLLTQTGSCVSF